MTVFLLHGIYGSKAYWRFEMDGANSEHYPRAEQPDAFNPIRFDFLGRRAMPEKRAASVSS